MTKYVLTVTLNPALDKMMLRNKVTLAAGGKGLNVSRTLHCLGIPAKATGLLGGENGTKIRQLLNEEDIPGDFVSIDGETRTNVTRLQGRTLGPAPAVTKAKLLAFEKKYRQLLTVSWIVTLNGSNAVGAPEDYYCRLIRLARKASVLTVLDSSGKAFSEGLKAKPDIIKPNLAEAQQALGMSIRSSRHLREALDAFRRKGIAIALLSLADRGAAGIFKEEMWLCEGPKVKMKTDVGCGDAFLGGFVIAAARNWRFPLALRFATACGTANGMGEVPGRIRLKDVRKLVSEIRLTRL